MEGMAMKINSQLIRAERTKRAWSQEYVAGVTGLGLRTIQRIEATGLASYASVKAIAAVFEMSTSDLVLEIPAVTAEQPERQAALSHDTQDRRQALPVGALLGRETRRKCMLHLRKKSLFSNEYIAEEEGIAVAELSRSWWRTQAELTVQEQGLWLTKQGVLKGTFGLFDGDAAIVKVTQPSGWRPRLVFQFDEREFEIRQKAWYSSTLLVKSNGSVVGSIRPKGLFATEANVDLPARFPLAIRVFIGWIAMICWDEAAMSGAFSGASAA